MAPALEPGRNEGLILRSRWASDVQQLTAIELRIIAAGHRASLAEDIDSESSITEV